MLVGLKSQLSGPPHKASFFPDQDKKGDAERGSVMEHSWEEALEEKRKDREGEATLGLGSVGFSACPGPRLLVAAYLSVAEPIHGRTWFILSQVFGE